MTRNFFRRVGFGLSPEQEIPYDPLEWSKSQVDRLPEFNWTVGTISHMAMPTTKDGLDHFLQWRKDEDILREKYGSNQAEYKKQKRFVRDKIKRKEQLELRIRLNESLKSGSPVFERLLMFWSNHFAIVEKNELPQLITGPYNREVIRANLTGNIETLTREATISWAMIEALDNSESIAPDSIRAKKDIKKGKTPSLNENHARELLELHTISPSAGYTQEDVINVAYIMAGWKCEWSRKRKRFNPVKFDQESHQPGEHFVLGKGYKQRNVNSKLKLFDLIADLVRHPSCREFISTKLCRHFITDNPTKEMISPILKTWEETDGDLPSIHKTLLEVAYVFAPSTRKFHNPEIWMKQVLNLSGVTNPTILDAMTVYNDLGHNPLRPVQPNGFSDFEKDWISPELLIRRLGYADYLTASKGIKLFKNIEANEVIGKNFDNYEEIVSWLPDIKVERIKLSHLYATEWMLYS